MRVVWPVLYLLSLGEGVVHYVFHIPFVESSVSDETLVKIGVFNLENTYSVLSAISLAGILCVSCLAHNYACKYEDEQNPMNDEIHRRRGRFDEEKRRSYVRRIIEPVALFLLNTTMMVFCLLHPSIFMMICMLVVFVGYIMNFPVMSFL